MSVVLKAGARVFAGLAFMASAGVWRARGRFGPAGDTRASGLPAAGLRVDGRNGRRMSAVWKAAAGEFAGPAFIASAGVWRAPGRFEPAGDARASGLPAAGLRAGPVLQFR
jgi:hypothetical protein